MAKFIESAGPGKDADARSSGSRAVGAASESPTREPALTLQRQIGNRAVGRLLDAGVTESSSAPPIQAKLTVGRTDDPLEKEADVTADRVMRAPDPDASISSSPPSLIRKCAACGEHKCAACEEEEKLHRKAAGGAGAAGSVGGGAAAPASAHQALKGPGRPLDPAARAFFEPRFGYDFGAVRVHTNADAAHSARDIGARAYTAGSSIVFAEGQHSTSTPDGKRLIAHELAHVVQQGKARRDRDVIRRAPWGACPEGERRSAANPFIYNAAEHNAVFQYKAKHPTHCVVTNEMIALDIDPGCKGEENDDVQAIRREFHHGHEVNRRSVESAKNVTRRPESKSGALIEEGLEKVKALQQPDIIDVTTHEIYDITTIGQRDRKRRKFQSRYLPLLNAITRRFWSAGEQLKPLKLTLNLPKLGTICYGQTDFRRWAGVIQYEVIKHKDDKESKKKKKKKEDKKEDKKKKKNTEKKEEEEKKKKKGKKEGENEDKKDGAPGGNIGFGIGIFSSGGGKGNAVLGVSINSHGSTYGTASAGIVYDANGDAVAAASVGAGAHVSGHMAGAATAGAAYHTSADAAAVATAGKGKRTDATALANASAGSSEDSSTVTIATASHGEGKDTDDISVAKKGSGSGSGEPGDGGKQGEHDADPAAATGGLEIPGKSDAETAKAVADAARIDAQLQKASQAQKDLLIYLAQQSGELEYEVPDSNWLVTFVTATKGLSEADIKFLQQQQWKPGNVSAEELRKQIDERLKNRNKPQGGEKKGAEAKQHDAPDAKDKKGADDKGAAAEVKKPDDTLKAASLDETADPKHVESNQEAYKRLLDRAKHYDWAHMGAAGVLQFGKEGVVFAPNRVSGALYISTVIKGKRTRVTADVAGLLTKGKGENILEIRSASILVTTDGRAGPGSALVGVKISLQP